MTHILIVEDDRDIVAVVKGYLEHAHYLVSVSLDGSSGLTTACQAQPDLIVLDWNLPGLDGLEFMRRLRLEQRTPIIMLTARGEEADRIRGLEGGADDYLVKPFSPRELVARVRATLRRVELLTDTPQDVLKRGPLVIDPLRRSVTLKEAPIELSALEFDLLYTLASQPGRVFRRDELLERVWGADFAGIDRVVDVHLSNLRGKLEADSKSPSFFITLRSVGYKFTEEVA
jgi:two-component system alkaline phosphatase synthesis response regulator PhoP